LDAWFAKTVENLPENVKQTFPFLICPKASKNERNKGYEDFGEKQVNDGRRVPPNNAFQRGKTLRKNTHPTVKPLKLMCWLVTLGSRKGDVVLDPFVGSGTTALAAKMLERQYIGIELNAEYMEIAKARIQPEHTSKSDAVKPQAIQQTTSNCPKCGSKLFVGKHATYCIKAGCDYRA
jgi:site-specific DNA-methyltransferase (adenine-specific)